MLSKLSDEVTRKPRTMRIVRLLYEVVAIIDGPYQIFRFLVSIPECLYHLRLILDEVALPRTNLLRAR
jgi:hypothetical protein